MSRAWPSIKYKKKGLPLPSRHATLLTHSVLPLETITKETTERQGSVETKPNVNERGVKILLCAKCLQVCVHFLVGLIRELRIIASSSIRCIHTWVSSSFYRLIRILFCFSKQIDCMQMTTITCRFICVCVWVSKICSCSKSCHGGSCLVFLEIGAYLTQSGRRHKLVWFTSEVVVVRFCCFKSEWEISKCVAADERELRGHLHTYSHFETLY